MRIPPFACVCVQMKSYAHRAESVNTGDSASRGPCCGRRHGWCVQVCTTAVYSSWACTQPSYKLRMQRQSHCRSLIAGRCCRRRPCRRCRSRRSRRARGSGVHLQVHGQGAVRRDGHGQREGPTFSRPSSRARPSTSPRSGRSATPVARRTRRARTAPRSRSRRSRAGWTRWRRSVLR